MRLLKTIIASAFAALALVAATVPASAQSNQATATTNVNVRSGPGTGFAVVDTLRRGDRVTIDYCRGTWCFVQRRGPSGWVSANFLARGGYQPAPRPPVVVQPPRPPVVVQPPRPPHWGGGHQRPPHWGGGNQRPPHWNQPRPPRWNQPGRPNPGNQVCYQGPNGYFCVGN